MPTFHVYRSNEKIDEMVGAVPSALKALVEKHNSKAVNGDGETVKADGKRKAATAEDDDEWVDEKDDSKTGEVSDKARIVLLEKEVKDLKARLSALEEAFDSGSKRRRVD
ncbi:hypothetical protein BCR33DRAFT_553582 [Rhizoclosmatium globosum]|uniref:Uncharacterized protein n=1 Tax=Rhizoclosmatium globosum TaxID=329046 RepID=A0A1Y2CS81_9FUNG|nr:hypothetical protein BCR33DRAFT_553582 [Rhizoclosmatium globosum]|eukprot:ORY49827.1 hypothetical protein BCR33DRAFT_553582 [Rhizoclosmatium globosum]